MVLWARASLMLFNRSAHSESSQAIVIRVGQGRKGHRMPLEESAN